METLMPEGKCARCGEKEPTYWFLFDAVTGLTNLGFCSRDCEVAFCAGIEGIRHSQVVL